MRDIAEHTGTPSGCCPRCRGRVMLEWEVWGWQEYCLNCGWRPVRAKDHLDRVLPGRHP